MFEVRGKGKRLTLQVIVTLMAIPYAFPIVVMVQGSFAGQGWGNYEAVLSRPELPLFFRNSIIIAVTTVALVYACTMAAAFAFSKLHVRGKEIIFWMLLACLTLPGAILLPTLFSTTLKLGFYNTYWAVILPLAALQIPFTVLFARTFVDGIPDDLLDAARIDGLRTRQVFRYVILPMSKPIAATIVVLTFVQAWNEYLFPLVLLQEPSTQTITQLPQFFIGQFSQDQTKVLAAAVITAIPEIVVYLSLQKMFERGLAAGALK
ncbi:MAG: carbohydrate ABC transporter permease [Bifidobacteriaceae bacterium]|jgi:multiple sugar transport system permease protein/raffinose/stachyose/melibiose transport system permease protein|nr:carbohydrate ABC transporter permease [Bifidobacteriaceae bacterium]